MCRTQLATDNGVEISCLTSNTLVKASAIFPFLVCAMQRCESTHLHSHFDSWKYFAYFIYNSCELVGSGPIHPCHNQWWSTLCFVIGHFLMTPIYLILILLWGNPLEFIFRLFLLPCVIGKTILIDVSVCLEQWTLRCLDHLPAVSFNIMCGGIGIIWK